MVDWDVVDKRRAKGWEWDRIAEDPKVGFHAEADAGDPGRALRALYYQRRSKSRRVAGDSDRPDRADSDDAPERAYSRLAWIGFVLAPMAGVWFLLAIAFPSPVGAYLAAIPWVGLILAVTVILLAYGLLRSVERWNKALRTALVVGIALGFCVAGALGGVALLQGCPTLTASTNGEPSSWEKAKNTEWTESGVPVFFFYGSIACPYCSASSWAMANALMAMGSLTGTYYGHSSPTDVDPDTPEVILASASLVSQYTALHVDESTDDAAITTPSTPSCVDQAYVSSYDSTGSIPFVVLGGIYIHVGTLVTPGDLRTPTGDDTGTPLTPQQVQGQIDNQSGPAWNAVSGQMYLMEAFLVKLNNGLGPAGVVSNPIVQADLKSIT